MNEFEGAIQEFSKVEVATVEKAIENQEDVVLFIGRETCPFCRRFAPKMGQARQELDVPAYFVNSEQVTQLHELSEFREKYGIRTVPGLLVSKEGNTRVVCDSSLSVEEIKQFIEA